MGETFWHRAKPAGRLARPAYFFLWRIGWYQPENGGTDMLRRIVSLFLFLPICLNAFLATRQAATQRPGPAAPAPIPAVTENEAVEVKAPSAILMDAATGTVLFEKNADERREPASVTKIMTLLLVMEALDEGRISMDDAVTASQAAAGKGGSQIYLEEGEQLPMDEMLKSVVVSSANDCATALAEHVAGSETAFVSMMNRRAEELGMTNTHFVNCTGLDDEPNAKEHLTTARDVAIMSRELLRHDRIRNYTTIWMDTVRNGQFGLSNTNKLVRFYEGTTGLKTGYTSTAGHCLSATARREGIELIAVILGGATSSERFADAKALLNWGFANYALVTPDLDVSFDRIPVKLGRENAVIPVPVSTEAILIAKSQLPSVTRTVELEPELEAPVEQGQQVGVLRVMAGKQELKTIPLVAAHPVPRLTYGEVFLKLLKKVCMGK